VCSAPPTARAFIAAWLSKARFLNHPPASGPAVLQVKRGIAFSAALEPLDVPDGNGCLREAESLDIMDTLDAMRGSARSGAWVELAD
jgi:hypothetical protein